ncbi:alpha/beta hydrolase [Nocardia sp. NBC_01503]|uniref:alpha/beta fold hydrolase n=1 Tax=Nocardia sp. NBC_01503 TaxID=2975997 RepID=UPI002E7BE91B|nr:alpha/beta fold hydrolase [Nocardia sp. NBC_01503]WTL29258.1 alpha/beta hydrolase [Nocardia sp. NBC_01503]
MRTSVRALAAIAAAALLNLTPGIAHADPVTPAAGCRDISFPVAQGTLATTLCLPPGGTADTVMVLMSGSNYNGTYWDFSYQPEIYNFRKAMNAAGYATLVADRLGNGASSRPLSLSLTATGTSEALHGIVQALRAGYGGGAGFEKVVTAGHSLTSSTSVMEASTYHDVDGVLLTGYSHTLSIPDVLGVISSYYPAVADPVFAGRGVDSGYLTTRPGARQFAFYGDGDFDPAVLATDEATKETFSLSEYPDGLLATLPGQSAEINVPIMLAVGSKDRLSCGPNYAICADSATLYAAEAQYYAPAARFRAFVLPGSGHSVNLALNTRDYQTAVIDWMKTI